VKIYFQIDIFEQYVIRFDERSIYNVFLPFVPCFWGIIHGQRPAMDRVKTIRARHMTLLIWQSMNGCWPIRKVIEIDIINYL